MINLPDLIKERKAKDLERAKRKGKTVKGKNPNLKPKEKPKKDPDSSSKLAASNLKGATNLLKDIFSDKGESYDGNYDSTGADVGDYGDFGGEMGIFSDSGSGGKGGGFGGDGGMAAFGSGGGGGFKEGGQIKKKTETKPKKRKNKRVVRGVGAAKRGYGKATYSKRMY